ncbi:MAG: chemotaxis protein [Anaerolineae bacterium]
MGKKVAVAVIHGVGKRTPEFAEHFINGVQERCWQTCDNDIVVRTVDWSYVLQDEEDLLWRKLRGLDLHYRDLRSFLINFVADAAAYQITARDQRIYNKIHFSFADVMRQLAHEAEEDAPLCVVSHSLGTVIASNYLWDLQHLHEAGSQLSPDLRELMDDSPLVSGETLTLFYTLGSPLALWSLRYEDFGVPIEVPSPRLFDYHPHLGGEWINFYDKDDVIAYPLRTLNSQYAQAVQEDRQINVGGLLESWNPLSHLNYWTDKEVLDHISDALMNVWKIINA